MLGRGCCGGCCLGVGCVWCGGGVYDLEFWWLLGWEVCVLVVGRFVSRGEVWWCVGFGCVF